MAYIEAALSDPYTWVELLTEQWPILHNLGRIRAWFFTPCALAGVAGLGKGRLWTCVACLSALSSLAAPRSLARAKGCPAGMSAMTAGTLLPKPCRLKPGKKEAMCKQDDFSSSFDAEVWHSGAQRA